ncbi:RsmD family RNA methyltransferase [Candidatus Saccharibacteria bacterium]|nr:RsmD family RNA methyltransferase [Candidatus Saccharibacteria bacterium]
MKGSIKITSGVYRGRELSSPRNNATHPMGSRERLALMNSLGSDVLDDAMVLDAFAGTGALGLEALSRGAKSVVFVESDRYAAAAIRRNLKLLKLADQDGEPLPSSRVELFEQSVEAFSKSNQATFSLIFADPPYRQITKKTLQPLLPFLAPKGYFVLSHPAGFDPVSLGGSKYPLELLRTKSYAAANISILQKKC